MSRYTTNFRCPRCGGKYFGTVLAFPADPTHPPLTDLDSAIAAYAAGKIILCGGHVIPLGLPHAEALRWIARTFSGSATVIPGVTVPLYRCHNSADGQRDVTEGAMHLGYGTHDVFLGASGTACGWEGPGNECGMEA